MTSLKQTKAKAVYCMACDETFRNNASYSRYVNLYICSKCGIAEALHGFFWSVQHAERENDPKYFQSANFNPYDAT